MILELGSIKKEAAACSKAFKGSKVGDWAVHVHHGAGCVEQLAEPPGRRIAYILSDKPLAEQALRLRLFRPVKEKKARDCLAKLDMLTTKYYAKLDTLTADYNAKRALLHLQVCVKGCPWDGETLFR